METPSNQQQQTYSAYRIFEDNDPIHLDDPLAGSNSRVGKRSFLVFRHNKYVTISTDAIAFFYVKNEYSIIVCFDRQEYFVNYSLEHIQSILSELQFFRLNRQHLINFNAVKEVEHYFARKLLVKLLVPVTEKLLVSKEKSRGFLRWLENR